MSAAVAAGAGCYVRGGASSLLGSAALTSGAGLRASAFGVAAARRGSKQRQQQRVAVRCSAVAPASETMTAALRHIPSSKLHVSTPTWWLESRFHFSFAGYYNPDNMEFGVLRVLNDDLVKPKAGFGTHGHRDMEIFSYVLDGKLTHKDSMGNGESLPRGSVQYMSAGRGVWIKPDRSGLQPNYGSREYKKEDRHNKIQHVITGVANKAANAVDDGQGIIPINQDVNVYISESDAGTPLKFKLNQGRQAYMICAEGSAKVNNDVVLQTRDAVEIRSNGVESDIDITALDQGAHFMLLEMQESS
eukprot:jgi/Chlat1/4423/Chrsp29S04560